MGKSSNTKSENKPEVISFRLKSSEFEPYKELMLESGLTKSELMRSIITSKSGNVELRKMPNSDIKRLVFLANKTSNNINQIAKKINTAHLLGTINESLFISLLNNLINIEKSFALTIERYNEC